MVANQRCLSEIEWKGEVISKQVERLDISEILAGLEDLQRRAVATHFDLCTKTRIGAVPSG